MVSNLFNVEQIIKKIFTLSLLVLLLFSSVSFSNLSSLANNSLMSIHNSDSLPEFILNGFNDKIRFQGNGYDYTPISNIVSRGNNFTAYDILNVSHVFSSQYTENQDISYSITPPFDYSGDLLTYNITNIETIKDNYTIESAVNQNKHELAWDNYIANAQRFTVTWDYAVFYGAYMTLYVNRISDLGDYSFELFLVKENASGFPEINSTTGALDYLSYDLNNPYNESNYGSLDNTKRFYDFEDVILEKGNYFIVANLSNVDITNLSAFYWKGGNTAPESVSYYRDSSDNLWYAPINYDFSLEVQLMRSDEFGNSINFVNPVSVDLRDNTVSITSLTQTISSIGLHDLTANSSINVLFNNSYSFTTSYDVMTFVTSVNSTSGFFSNSWNLTWNTPYIDYSPYINLIRNQFIPAIPTDWNDTFIFYIDDIEDSYISEKNGGYSINLFDKNTALNLKITSFSQNYITNAVFSDEISETDNYVLGTWSPDPSGDNATGIAGSTIFTEVGVMDIIKSGGTLNFTLFNNTGDIISQKNYTELLAWNLIYSDISNYTGIGYIDESVYKHNITIDPSVYGTDVEGYWTAVVFWQNGTEVGLFSKRIAVEKPTLAEFEWEETLGQSNWTNDTFVELTRINGHGISARIRYYNISDPFFSGIGTEIPSADVHYDATWGETGFFNFGASEYSKDIITNALIGKYNVSLTASGPFLELHTIQFSVNIIHQFDINPEKNNYYVNYTNSLSVRFGLRDISYGNILITPDTINIILNGNPLTMSNYSLGYPDNLIDISLDTNDLDLDIGDHELEIIVTKNDFVDDYGITATSTSTTITVTEIPVIIQVIEIETEVDINTQTSLSFKLIDTNHSTDISGASFNVSFDLLEVELIEKYETNGIYTITFRINEPTKATLNIYLNITKAGYETKLDYRLPETITIDIPGNGIPLGVLIALVVVAVVIGGGTGTFFFLRARRSAKQKLITEKKAKARNLFQSAFMIRKILIVHHETSLPVYEMNLEENIGLDSSMITGVLQAISSIGMEMIGAPTGVKKIEYYGFVVTSAYSGAYTCYVFSETELDSEIVNGVYNLSKWFDVIFGYDSEQWDGSMDLFNEYKDTINEKVFQELYLWMIYPIELAPDTMKSYDSFSPMNKKIIDFINKKGKTTVMVLVDNIEDFEDEMILNNIIELVKKEIIITHTND